MFVFRITSCAHPEHEPDSPFLRSTSGSDSFRSLIVTSWLHLYVLIHVITVTMASDAISAPRDTYTTNAQIRCLERINTDERTYCGLIRNQNQIRVDGAALAGLTLAVRYDC